MVLIVGGLPINFSSMDTTGEFTDGTPGTRSNGCLKYEGGGLFNSMPGTLALFWGSEGETSKWLLYAGGVFCGLSISMWLPKPEYKSLRDP
jgi:hypothetical protein